MENPQWQPIGLDSKAMIDRLWLERVPLARIARVMQVPEDWLQGYVKRCYEAVPRTVVDGGHWQQAVGLAGVGCCH